MFILESRQSIYIYFGIKNNIENILHGEISGLFFIVFKCHLIILPGNKNILEKF